MGIGVSHHLVALMAGDRHIAAYPDPASAPGVPEAGEAVGRVEAYRIVSTLPSLGNGLRKCGDLIAGDF